jgi:hypothetical protein
MHRTALGLTALLTLIVPGTASLAQQPDRLAESVPLDCGYVCIFATSTEPIESIGQAAAVRRDATQWSLALAQVPRPRAVVDRSASSDGTAPSGF